MTPRERLLCALNHKRADRVPFEFDFTPPLYEVFKKKTGSDSPFEYFDMDIKKIGLNPTRLNADFTRYFGELPKGVSFDEWGVGHLPSGLYHFDAMLPPLANKSLEVLENYPFPDVNEDYRFEGLDDIIEDIHNRGYAVAFCSVLSIFETSWYLRGMENLLIDMLEENEFATLGKDGGLILAPTHVLT